MRATSQEDERLVGLTKICLALPRTEREIQGLHASFKVKKKVFAYFLNDHHGDGIVGVTCKVLPGDNAALIKADPKRFYMPAYVGPRGWVGLRLDVGKVDWGEVQELVVGSYQLTAGKRLAGAVKQVGDSAEF
jgi:predicted DNA-binding protein (MmcQ/YjbR family)